MIVRLGSVNQLPIIRVILRSVQFVGVPAELIRTQGRFGARTGYTGIIGRFTRTAETTKTAIVTGKYGIVVVYGAGLDRVWVLCRDRTSWSDLMEPSKPKSELAERLHSLSGAAGPHDLFKLYRAGAALNVRILPLGEGEEGVPSVLIEGDEDTLVFLADLLLAQVQDSDCGTGISPSGPGSVFFNPQSQYGIYVHVLPCKDQELAGKK
jgi:hypothetical protein